MDGTWYYHPLHGYMFLGPEDEETGWQIVVTALCSGIADLMVDEKLWEAHKHRLSVNAGSGAIVANSMKYGDRNPEFEEIDAEKVPAHIVRDFMARL